MNIREISDKDLIEKGTKVLFEELGYSDTLRFLSMSRELREESVQRHRRWQEGLDKNRFFDKVFGRQSEEVGSK